MTEAAPNIAPEPDEPAKRRRWPRRLLWGGLSVFLTLFIVGIGLRLYFNDERLRVLFERTLTERTGCEVTLRDLELGVLWGGRLEGLVVGPPEGFERRVVELERLALEYDLWALIGWVFHVERFEVEGLTLAQETRAGGETNVAAILARLSPSDAASPQPAEPVPPPKSDAGPLPELPTLPLGVQLDALRVGPVAVILDQGEQVMRLDGYHLEASFGGAGDDYRLELWTGLGERSTDGAPSRLQLERDGQFALTGEQRLGIELHFGGYDDITLGVRWDGRTDANAPIDAPPVQSQLELDASADLLARTAEIHQLRVSVGEGTEFNARAAGEALLSDPLLTLAELSFRADLDGLEPLAAAVVDGVSLGGQLEASLEPTRVRLSSAADLSLLETGLSASANEVRGAAGANGVEALNGTLMVRAARDQARIEAQFAAASARGGEFSLRDVGIDFEVNTALSAWVASKGATARAENRLETRGEVTVGTVNGPGLSLAGARTRMRAAGPVALLRGEASDVPLELAFEQRLTSATTGGQRLTTVNLTSSASLYDLRGEAADLDARLTIAAIRSALGEGQEVRLPPLSSTLRATRRGQRVTVPTLQLRVGEDFALDGALDADRVLTDTPRLYRAELFLQPFDVQRAIALLPEPMRPAQSLRGIAGFDAQLEGRVPISKLTRAFRPPKPGRDLSETLTELDRTLERLAGLFESGMPFTGHIGLELNDAAFSDAQNEVEGLSLDADLNVLETGPRFDVAVLLDRVTRPSRLSALSLQGALGFEGRTLFTQGRGEVGSYRGPGLPKPLRGATGKWRLTYEVGGTLALEELELLAPDRDGRLYSSFVVQQPMKVAREQRWASSGMPGVDVSARFESRLRVDDEAPIEIPGLELDGGFGMNSELRIVDGVIDFAGLAFTEHLSMENEAAVVSDLDGGIPFELAFATSPQDGFVPLPQRVLFGDGVLRLRIERSVRLASARPLYYDRIRRYRSDQGLKIEKIESKGFLIEHLELDGGLRDGAIVAERARLSILGGDIAGSMSMRISGERAVAGAMDMKISNIDASYFPALDLDPGRDSEVDADGSIQFAFSNDRRDLTANMNVTRISSTALDRFLQLLDPKEQNQSIQGTRFWLNLAQINGVAMWLAYENLNMDLDANSIIKVPFTSVGFPSFERELLRREPMGERLDIMLDPVVERVFGPLVGISRGR